MRPAAKPPSSRSRPRWEATSASAKTSTTIQRTASCELLSIVRSTWQGAARRAYRHNRDGHGQGDEGDQDQRVVQRALRREDQRQQQDRPELPDRAGGEEIRAEPRAQLAGVREDGDQGADRRRRQRRPHVDERHDDAGRGQHAAERVGDGERQRPAHAGRAAAAPRGSARCRSRSRRRRRASRARGLAKKSVKLLTWARSSACGPITTPRQSSTTTTGMKMPRTRCHARQGPGDCSRRDDRQERSGIDAQDGRRLGREREGPRHPADPWSSRSAPLRHRRSGPGRQGITRLG